MFGRHWVHNVLPYPGLVVAEHCGSHLRFLFVGRNGYYHKERVRRRSHLRLFCRLLRRPCPPAEGLHQDAVEGALVLPRRLLQSCPLRAREYQYLTGCTARCGLHD